MTADDLRKLYWAEPFEPFQLELRDGRRITVAQREWMAISPTGDSAVVAPTVLQMEFIDIPQIMGLRFFSQSTTMPTNGAA
jgi:hypothetical protein